MYPLHLNYTITLSRKTITMDITIFIIVLVLKSETYVMNAVRNLPVVCHWNSRRRSFFTDNKNFYLNPPVNHQDDRVWSVGKKRDVNKRRLVVERAKFAKYFMVSAGVCYGGNWILHLCAFHPGKAKVNGKFYRDWLTIACKSLLPSVCTCTYGEAGSKLDTHQLQWLHRKRRMATELSRP